MTEGMELRKRRRVSISFKGEESLTKQSHAAECDLNRIMERALKQGMLPPMSNQQGTYADVSEMGDFQVAHNKLRNASDFFHSLPASVRRQFDDSVKSFLEWSAEPANFAELAALSGEPQKPEPADSGSGGGIVRSPGDAGGVVETPQKDDGVVAPKAAL